MPTNLLKNDGFENKLKETFAHWRGWYLHPNEGAVCVYQKQVANAPTGFYQDVPADRLKSNGNYRFQMKLLSPTANAVVKPTVWVVKPRGEGHVDQKRYILKLGRWQIVEVVTNINRKNLKRVRVELYFEPTNCEVIIQRAYFGK
jgi:hypothetical protein